MINIREISATELEILLDLYKDLHEHDAPVILDTAQNTWTEIQNNPRIKYFGVFADNKLVSTCTITIIPNLTRACCPYGLIENVVTGKNIRQQGFGKAVLEHTLNYAWQQNCYKVMLMTGRLDEDTFAFYESVGFEKESKQAFIAKPKI